MVHLFETLFSSSEFMPRGHCYLWTPTLVWTMFTTDLLIGLAYVGILLSLYGLVRKIKTPFSGVFAAFGIFIAACGATHFMEVWTLWHATYWLSALIKVVTAVASIATAILLVKLNPEIVKPQRRVGMRTHERQPVNRNFEVLFETIPQLVWSTDSAGESLYFNQNWLEITGTTLKENLGMKWLKVIHPDDTNRVSQEWKKAVSEGSVYETEYRIRCVNGSYRWYLVRGLPIKDEQARVTRWFGTSTNINDQQSNK